MVMNEHQLLDLIRLGEGISLEFKTCRCNGRIYDRNEDGDLDITDHTFQVANLYHRKQAVFTENRIYPYAGLKDLRSDLIEKCRKIARVNTPGHSWADMDDLQLIQSAQLFQTDPKTGKSGVTLAGILLLGTDQLILSAVPAHRTDLILRKVDLDRYDDRDLVRTNLIDSYDRIIAFVQKHLPDPFFLEGINRISIRDAIFREIASNILIHREYTSAFPAKLIIEYGQVRTENASKPHGFGVLDPDMFTPYPKNPVIGAFFREIHRADELGSGMRKMMRYCKAYGGTDPQMIEGDVFRIIAKVPEFGYSVAPALSGAGEEWPEVQSVVQSMTQSGAQSIELLMVLYGEPCSSSQLVERLGLKSKTGAFKRLLQRLLDKELIEYTVPERPSSRVQKYRITPKGRQLLEMIEL